MTNFDPLPPTQDQRIMAALSHVTILMPFFGIIAPIVVWVTQKEKSQYVAFQALQALVYQLSMIVAGFVSMGCYMCSFFSTFATLFFARSAEISQPAGPPANIVFFIIPFLIFGAIFVGGAAFMVYGIVGAVMTFQGKPFRYIIIGNRVERYMQKK